MKQTEAITRHCSSIYTYSMYESLPGTAVYRLHGAVHRAAGVWDRQSERTAGIAKGIFAARWAAAAQSAQGQQVVVAGAPNQGARCEGPWPLADETSYRRFCSAAEQ
jgi:hypothetical protein